MPKRRTPNLLTPDLLAPTLAASPVLRPILSRWRQVDLPDAWLVAGAVAQTLWNRAHGFAAGFGVRDVDIVYFDPDDLSAEAESRHAARLAQAFDGTGLRLDVKNQARVHLWYPARFGRRIAPYGSVAEAIATFPSTATAVGVRPGADGLAVCAPFGLDDLLNLTVRPNKALVSAQVYAAKAARWQALWPGLRIVAWQATP